MGALYELHCMPPSIRVPSLPTSGARMCLIQEYMRAVYFGVLRHFEYKLLHFELEMCLIERCTYRFMWLVFCTVEINLTKMNVQMKKTCVVMFRATQVQKIAH